MHVFVWLCKCISTHVHECVAVSILYQKPSSVAHHFLNPEVNWSRRSIKYSWGIILFLISTRLELQTHPLRLYVGVHANSGLHAFAEKSQLNHLLKNWKKFSTLLMLKICTFCEDSNLWYILLNSNLYLTFISSKTLVLCWVTVFPLLLIKKAKIS